MAFVLLEAASRTLIWAATNIVETSTPTAVSFAIAVKNVRASAFYLSRGIQKMVMKYWVGVVAITLGKLAMAV